MNIKLQNKIKRQQAKQDQLFGSYTLSQKRATKVRYSQNGLWKHNNVPQHNEFEIVLGGKIYKKVVR